MLSLKPRVRGGFSDRTKKEPINTIIQKDNLDERTRNKIINIIDVIIDNRQNIIDGIKKDWQYYDIQIMLL